MKSFEGGKRKKEKPKRSALKTLRNDAIIAASVLGVLHGASTMKKHDADQVFDKPEIQKSDRLDIQDKKKGKKKFEDFRRSDNIIDRRFETAAESMQPLEQYDTLASRAQQDEEYALRNSEMAKALAGRKMPRDTHSVNTWNKKNQIDHAIKKAQRDVLFPQTDPRKKK